MSRLECERCKVETCGESVERHSGMECQREVMVGDVGIGKGCVGIEADGNVVGIYGIPGHMPVDVGYVDIRADCHGTAR